MPSFLVTSRMPPALRARVQAALEADLRQRTLFPNRGRARHYVRLLLAGLALCLLAYLAVTFRQSRREVEAVRAALLVDYRRLSQRAPATTRARLHTLSQQLGMLHAATEPNANVGSPADLESLLRRPFLYVRGDAQRMTTPGSSADTAREGEVDALALCLVTPPDNLRESTLLRSIGKAAPEGRVFSLSEAWSALDFFESSFEGQVQTAEHMQELQNLRARLKRPTLKRGTAALEAEVLFIAVDEPKAAGIVSDFDGEAPHDIVLLAIDIASGRRVWQRRVHVDPSWISEKSRLAYSRSLDSCRLAYELKRPSDAAQPP